MADHHRLLLDDPWTVNPADFPADGTSEEKLLFLINYAVLAPSILNTQPWRFRVTGAEVDVLADRTRLLPVTDPHGRELTISCGAALLNLRVAMRGFGYGCETQIFSDASPPYRLAAVKLKALETPSETDRRLRDAIPVRRTNRHELGDRPLPPDLLTDLGVAVQSESATLTFTDSPEARHLAVDLVAEAEQTLLADPKYRRELGDWIGQRVGEATVPHRGPHTPMAGHTPTRPPQPDLRTPNAASTARMFSQGDEAQARHKKHLAAAPILALLTTDADTPKCWIAAGQALQRMLLVATVANASASFLNPPIEVPALRPRVARIFGTRAMPQVLLRFGYGPQIPPEARRRISEVIDKAAR